MMAEQENTSLNPPWYARSAQERRAYREKRQKGINLDTGVVEPTSNSKP